MSRHEWLPLPHTHPDCAVSGLKTGTGQRREPRGSLPPPAEFPRPLCGLLCLVQPRQVLPACVFSTPTPYSLPQTPTFHQGLAVYWQNQSQSPGAGCPAWGPPPPKALVIWQGCPQRGLLAPRGGFPGGASGKEPTCQHRRYKRRGLNPWSQEDPLEEGSTRRSKNLFPTSQG